MNIIKMEAEKTGYICLKNHKIDWDCKKEEGNIFSKFFPALPSFNISFKRIF
jgi:hypothetical protein